VSGHGGPRLRAGAAAGPHLSSLDWRLAPRCGILSFPFVGG
jgi:hypothetical protein